VVILKGKVQLAEGLEPEEGKVYEITRVEEVETLIQRLKGLRVVMKSIDPKDLNTYATMLWYREVAGTKSKLGAFIKAFKDFLGSEEAAMDTNNWIGHKVRFISWSPRKREVRVIE
jgi:hypothetical protein